MAARPQAGKVVGAYVSVPSTGSESEGERNAESRIPPKLKKKIKAAANGFIFMFGISPIKMKPRNGHLKPSSQDYMNLLYSETDSDTPDLKLPPLKGKKTRKKKSFHKSVVSGDTSVCSVWVMMKIIIIVVMLATLSVLGIVSYWLMGQVNDLKVQLEQVENRNQGAPEEFQKYHTQIQDLNRTVHNIKTGDKGIDKITKNLTDIANQLTSLNMATQSLKDSLDEAPHLKSLPKQFETLTSTVVKMGSDIQSAQGKVETLEDFKKSALEDLAKLKKKVADMENKTQIPSTPLPGREHGNSPAFESDNGQVTQKLQVLSLDIDTLNKSLVSKLGALNSSLLMHDTRLGLLENFTSQHMSTPGGTSGQTKYANTLKQLLGGDSGTPTDELSALTGLVDKVDNITTMVAKFGHLYDKLQSDITSVNASISTSAVASSDILPTEILQSVEYLNSTVLKLSDNLDKLFKLYIKNRNELTNTTTHVHGILQYLALSANGTHGTSKPLPSEMAAMPTPAGTTTTGTPGPTSPPAIKMELVKNMSDLQTNFNRWDRQGTGQVDPDDLQDYMPDPPTPDQLKPFDADNNGKYSLEEFAVALGFKSETKEEVDHIFQ